MQAIKKETSGSFQNDLLTIVRCATDSALYFAKVIVVPKLYVIFLCTLFFFVVVVFNQIKCIKIRGHETYFNNIDTFLL